MSGILYGIGLGPGDPELITRKAARLIGAAGVVAYPALPGGESLARSIAADLLAEGVSELVVEVPMTSERGPAQAAYELGGERIGEALAAGMDVVFLCEGDPFFYGSFMYLHARLAADFRVEVVPGVMSLNAASALVGMPLVARNQVLSVLPAPLEDSVLATGIDGADTLAIVKVGRHLGRVRSLIERLGLLGCAMYVERASMAGERLLPLKEAPDPAPYFSMIVITKGADPWLKTRL